MPHGLPPNIALYSIDGEFSGPDMFSHKPEDQLQGAWPPRKPFSLLSFGAVPILYQDGLWRVQENGFYTEIKPISDAFDTGAMEVACLGLECLGDDPRFDPASDRFNPGAVLEHMVRHPDVPTPEEAVGSFEIYIAGNTPSGLLPVPVAHPIRADMRMVDMYLDAYGTGNTLHARCHNVLGYGGIDIRSYMQGLLHDLAAHPGDLGLRELGGLRHNALSDARQQAEEIAVLLNK